MSEQSKQIVEAARVACSVGTIPRHFREALESEIDRHLPASQARDVWQPSIDVVFDIQNENELNDGGFFEAGFIAAKTKILDALIEARDAGPPDSGIHVSSEDVFKATAEFWPPPDAAQPPDARPRQIFDAGFAAQPVAGEARQIECPSCEWKTSTRLFRTARPDQYCPECGKVPLSQFRDAATAPLSEAATQEFAAVPLDAPGD